jgi:hypothetical protein
VAYLSLVNKLATSGCAAFRRGIAAKLKAEGIDAEASGAIFVDFAPVSEPLLYDGFSQWDVGFLFPAGDRLTYIGERARFSLTRGQITDICLGRGVPSWLRGRRALVSWHDPAIGTSGTVAFWPGDPRSLWQLRRGATALTHHLLAWRNDDDISETSTSAELGPPKLGTIHATAPRDTVRLRAMIGAILLWGLLEVALCVLLGVPFAPTLTRGAGYALAVMVGTLIAQVLPFWVTPRQRVKKSCSGAVLSSLAASSSRSDGPAGGTA